MKTATASLLLLLSALFDVPGARGGTTTCDVPGDFPTLQAAVDDEACTEVVVAAGLYPETVDIARSLTLRGAGVANSTVEGRLRITGSGAEIALFDLTIDASGPSAVGCYPQALLVAGGAEVSALDVAVLNSQAGQAPVCPLFDDGFESGDTSAWSATVP